MKNIYNVHFTYAFACIIIPQVLKVKETNYESKVLKMESVFEIIMSVLFDSAVLLLILHPSDFESKKRSGKPLLFGSFALGFLFAAIETFAFGKSPAAFALFVFGFIISAEAFVVTFSKKSEKNESC